jgi:uncharacterized protein (TIGR02145 family)
MQKLSFFTIILMLMVIFSCEDENEEVFQGVFSPGQVAQVEIKQVDSIRDVSAKPQLKVLNEGKGYILEYGVCWGTSKLPTLQGNHVSVTDTAIKALSITNLTRGTLYYVRPYIANNAGLSYGAEISFTTKNEPTVLTKTALAAGDSATISAEVTDNGGDTATIRGVCWSTTTNPTIALATKKTNGKDTGAYSVVINGLTKGTTYYAKAYAVNPYGTVYGSEVSFTTQNTPQVSTKSISYFTDVLAFSGGNITNDGGAPILSRGICWSTSPSPTVEMTTKTIDGSGTGSYNSMMTGLTANITYYVRAYATNSMGTSYGEEFSFVPSLQIPTIKTTVISSITTTTAKSGGDVTLDGGATVTARGVCWSTVTNPTINDGITSDGTGLGSFTSFLGSLLPNTTYYVRAYATNSVGTAYGNEVSFKTSPILSELSTSSVSAITTSTAICGGNINSDGGATVTAKGVCWSTSSIPTTANSKSFDGTGTGSFTSSITGLSPSTTYYVRAYATNSVGTAYGNELSFTTSAVVTSVVEVLNPTTGKIWMDRNLGASRAAISSTDSEAYGDLYQWGRGTDGHEKRTSGTTGSLSSSDSPGHGNFITVSSGNYDWRSTQNDNLWQGVNGINNPCPSGFRLPTIAEWTAERVSWSSNNSSGAFASPLKLPEAGYRSSSNGTLGDVGSFGIYWSVSVSGAYVMYLSFGGSDASTYSSFRATGLSVRCIKDVALAQPTLSTTTISLITSTTAISGGNITSDGGSTVTAKGVCWSTSTTPTISNSKTSNGTGTGSFTSSITGLSPSTTYCVRAYATNSVGTAYGNEFCFTTTSASTFSTVISPAGKVWMDRNLGASRVATSSTDAESYGDLYQWGRGTDGHEKRTSATTSFLSSSDTPGHGNFITINSGSYDWRSTQNNNLWQGVNGINNPCPEGFRLPTKAEWESELMNWSSNNLAGAFASPLKLPVAGYRIYSSGPLSSVGSLGGYWSATVNGTYSLCLSFGSGIAYTYSDSRAYGFSVRCIKDK